MEDEVTLRATFLRPAGNGTGTFRIAPEDVATLDAWRTTHNITTQIMKIKDPATGEALPAFGPVEGNQLAQVERERNVRDGQRCRVTYRVKSRAGRPTFSFVGVEADG